MRIISFLIFLMLAIYFFSNPHEAWQDFQNIFHHAEPAVKHAVQTAQGALQQIQHR